MTNLDRVTVEEVAVNLPGTSMEFSIPLSAGMIVRDNIAEEGLRVAADGQTLIPIRDEATSGVWGYIVGAAFTLVGLWMLVRWYVRYRRNAGLTTPSVR